MGQAQDCSESEAVAQKEEKQEDIPEHTGLLPLVTSEREWVILCGPQSKVETDTVRRAAHTAGQKSRQTDSTRKGCLRGAPLSRPL